MEPRSPTLQADSLLSESPGKPLETFKSFLGRLVLSLGLVVLALEKTLMLGGIGGRRTRGQQRMRRLDGIADLMDMGLGGLGELVMDTEARHAAVHEVSKIRT